MTKNPFGRFAALFGCVWLSVVLLSLSSAVPQEPDAPPAVETAEPMAQSDTDASANSATEPSESTSEEVADEDEESMGVDEWINAKFEPYSDWWIGLVLTPLPEFIPIVPKGTPIVLILLVFGALFFTIYFGFVNFRLVPLAIRVVSGKYADIEKAGAAKIKAPKATLVEGEADTDSEGEESGEVSHFQALATAVSGTVGLGNISGVAVAIATGGPGATFWMIICGLLGMSTKFVECTLGVAYRDLEPDGTVHGGPMYYLQKGFGEKGLGLLGKILGGLFAILCIGASFGGGNMFQANQATAQIQTLFGLVATDLAIGEQSSFLMQASGAMIGILLAILVALVIIGGIKRIATVTEKVVPLMAVIYVLAAMVIIIWNFHLVPYAFRQIIAGAFTPEAGLGGIMGVIIVGFQRAAFSNEAGAGSAAIAHSAVRTRYPASEGVVALLEPFIDTVVICTMTAIVIVLFNSDNAFTYGDVESSGVLLIEQQQRIGGVDLTSLAFDSALPNFRYVLTIAIILFAFSTMISWSYYGLQSWKYLFGRSGVSDLTYKIAFCVFVVIGAASSLDAVINFSDAMILALVFPNMIGLLVLAPRVRKELRRYLKAIGE